MKEPENESHATKTKHDSLLMIQYNHNNIIYT